LDRTRLAYERTLMAWVRTATSLISFGLTIYKVFQYMEDRPAGGLFGPRPFAMLTMAIGLTALVLATVEHRRHRRTISSEYGTAAFSMATVAASFVGILGILGLLAVWLRQ
jgi:putative membrane protein